MYEAYIKAIRQSKWKETTQKFSINYLRNIIQIQKELDSKIYNPGVGSYFVLHERGKIRPITALPTKDRIIRHVICDDILMPKILSKIIYDNYASIENRGISFARKRFENHLHKYYERTKSNKGYILFGDFRKFYDNIVHENAKKQLLDLVDQDLYLNWILDIIFKTFQMDVSYLSEKDYKECIYEVFDRLEYEKISKEQKTKKLWMEKSVNIGDQLSQIIGIYYPNEIDTYVKYVCKMKNYGRYVDDFFIISENKEDLYIVLDGIRNITRKLGIHINENKTKIVRMDQIFRYLQVQYQVTDSGHIIKKINPKRVASMRKKLKKLAKKLDDGEADYNSIEEMYRSWMGNFYKIMSKDQRKNLINLYEDLFLKEIIFVNRSGKRKMLIRNKKEETQYDVQST